jgi:hypothetical protein
VPKFAFNVKYWCGTFTSETSFNAREFISDDSTYNSRFKLPSCKGCDFHGIHVKHHCEARPVFRRISTDVFEIKVQNISYNSKYLTTMTMITSNNQRTATRLCRGDQELAMAFVQTAVEECP